MKKRIAFSIVYNALHHLNHNDQANKIISMFDHWIIIEGAAGNKGSTSWCNDYHRPAISTDGTREFIVSLQEKHPDKITYLLGSQMWDSKDVMCHNAMQILQKMNVGSCFLWQIDADEQWNADQLLYSEQILTEHRAKVGMFFCDHFVGEDLIAKGDWGEGIRIPYKRLFDWNGEQMSVHEPPTLEGGNGKEVMISARFKHYAYYFDKDVYFKSKYYGGHGDIYDNWIKLQLDGERKKISFPAHISVLFGKNSWVGNTNTFIVKT